MLRLTLKIVVIIVNKLLVETNNSAVGANNNIVESNNIYLKGEYFIS